eukprot:TRINITY_DN14675_c0_g1_i1.p1 TRINITY_DN14675_c0_g1~~TRINITY_DN14675_c0_g1_i1.p1  ORF type:complete len:319 (-),score=64.86 TRINITY_DN14675_c0_g1_i1:118-1074(-)
MSKDVSLEDVKQARERIKKYTNLTPVLTCSTLDKLAGKKLFFKCEIFQKVGAFKFRGACNAIMKLPDEIAARGVVTHSSGNHAQAVALAAKIRGIKATIVMPEGAPLVKKKGVLDYGASVVMCENNAKSREDTAKQIIDTTGSHFVPPYDDVDVIAGQGTLALELLEQVPEDLQAIIVPVGGGGMLSGVSVAAKGINPSIRIYAAEPKGADDAYQSMQLGKIVPQTNPQTCADGLRTSLGEITFPLIRKYVERVITVSEDEIKSAMRLVWERMKLVIEPSAAVGVAVALSSEFKALEGIERVGIVLCGGNLDLDQWKW